jgi:hypothetical protein
VITGDENLQKVSRTVQNDLFFLDPIWRWTFWNFDYSENVMTFLSKAKFQKAPEIELLFRISGPILEFVIRHEQRKKYQ